MKKIPALIVLSALCLLCFMPVELGATEKYGTFTIGGKAWAALWDSAINRLQQKDTEMMGLWMMMSAPIYKIYKPKGTGKGILGGPVIGYQTPDKKWNISLAFMWFSYFEAMAKNETYLLAPTFMPFLNNFESVKYKYERREIDFAPSYTVGQYWKFFLGYKFQWANIKGSSKVEMMNHSIAPGAGFFYPLGEYFVLGLQANVLCVIPQPRKQKMIAFVDFTTKSAHTVNMGINGEISISTLIAGHLMIQLGYRAQVIWVDLIGSMIQMHTRDFFHGLTLTAAASF